MQIYVNGLGEEVGEDVKTVGVYSEDGQGNGVWHVGYDGQGNGVWHVGYDGVAYAHARRSLPLYKREQPARYHKAKAKSMWYRGLPARPG